MDFLYLSIPDPQREGQSPSHIRVSGLSSFLPPLLSFPFFHIFTLFLVVGVGTTEVYSLAKSQVCNTLLLTKLTMLHMKFPELIHLTTESLYPLTYMSSFPPHPAPDNHNPTYCFYEYDLFRLHTDHIVFVFLHLDYFTEHNTLKVCPYCCKLQEFFLCYG